MARGERLARLMTVLRDGRLHRAEDLARRLGVSLRTIYRDMETLMASGVPIEGERGRGYRATDAVTLPPLALSPTELEALHVGLAAVGASGDDELAAAARRLSERIDAVLPEDRSTPPAAFGFALYPFDDLTRGFRHLPVIRAALRARQKLAVRLHGGQERVMRPLSLDYWGRVWILVAWDETQADFAAPRLDEIEEAAPLPALFVDEPGKTLADYRARPGGH